MRWPGPFTVVAIPIALALVVDLATETIRIKAPWWPMAVWTTVGVLVAVAVRVEWMRSQAMRVSSVDPAVMLGQAAEDLAEAVARQWRAEVNARGLGMWIRSGFGGRPRPGR